MTNRSVSAEGFYRKHGFGEISRIVFLAKQMGAEYKMIGMDTPSPDKHPFDIHKFLFEHRIPIAENLTNLELLLHVKSFEVIARLAN